MPDRINTTKQNTSRYVTFKQLQTKEKEKILKAARGKKGTLQRNENKTYGRALLRNYTN